MRSWGWTWPSDTAALAAGGAAAAAAAGATVVTGATGAGGAAAAGALPSVVRKPSVFFPTRRSMILSSPTKAPPQMKRMFVVSIW
jgi:hypothetical protein